MYPYSSYCLCIQKYISTTLIFFFYFLPWNLFICGYSLVIYTRPFKILMFKKGSSGVPWWPSRLRIWHHCYGSGLIPGPGTSAGLRHGQNSHTKKPSYVPESPIPPSFLRFVCIPNLPYCHSGCSSKLTKSLSIFLSYPYITGHPPWNTCLVWHQADTISKCAFCFAGTSFPYLCPWDF